MNELSLLDRLSSFLLQTELISVCDDFNKCQAKYKIQNTIMNYDGVTLFQAIKAKCEDFSLSFDIKFSFNSFDPILITRQTTDSILQDKI
ncbi:hypothetical protein NOM03_16960, partial [Proteus terrae]